MSLVKKFATVGGATLAGRAAAAALMRLKA